MEIYKTVLSFTDLSDGKVYMKNDVYFTADADRAKELSSKDNKRGTVLIQRMTKPELVEFAGKQEIEIDKKMKVDELHAEIAEQLLGDSNE